MPAFFILTLYDPSLELGQSLFWRIATLHVILSVEQYHVRHEF
jgi:hypothetical protein